MKPSTKRVAVQMLAPDGGTALTLAARKTRPMWFSSTSGYPTPTGST